jgi:hypothetical protein
MDNIKKQNSQEMQENSQNLNLMDIETDKTVTEKIIEMNNQEKTSLNNIESIDVVSMDNEHDKQGEASTDNNKDNNNINNSNNKLSKSGPKNKIKTSECSNCGLIEDVEKLLKCETCKLYRCRDCAAKENHFLRKKRDQSSYICGNCIENSGSNPR